MIQGASYQAGRVPRPKTSPDEAASLAVFSDLCHLVTVISSAVAFVICVGGGGVHVTYYVDGCAIAMMMIAICLSIRIEILLLLGRKVWLVPSIRKMEATLAAASAVTAACVLVVEIYLHVYASS